ncbi:Putative cupin like domain protein [Candidatus Deianiraea vastatrix]|uniref:Cupin like domain protein n=1 Tax=Candidatus Deianiraea vastatrix TaxID=2163644 RepID=A0A5B8XHX3_9RICK|nr:Putative cupin like domain protein [Candidatus Deianiraea vastatrix]
MIWREMFNFSQDCVLMVLASDYYDESEYVRNYEEFLKLVNV